MNSTPLLLHRIYTIKMHILLLLLSAYNTVFYFHIICKIMHLKNQVLVVGKKIFKYVICSIDNWRVRTDLKRVLLF